ncbi:1-deoxy-D-xylulose-5-phosphate reductoisomerase [Acetobacteraceae bacterium]|nr:1-deoxy-D-xylulose-5-phosphate reductoisomerase [Acetobacteraceae bacterium]
MNNHKEKNPRTVTVLGSTGSIGVSTVDLLKNAKEDFSVRVLVGGSNVHLLAEQAKALDAEWAVLHDEEKFPHLKALLSETKIKIAAGRKAVIEAASIPVDWTMAAITGAAGLEPILAAARNGGDIALANKEALVCAGSVLLEAIRKSGGRLLPVDSEHNAIVQALGKSPMEEVEKILLTASGGPFRTFSREEMKSVTPEMALKHPTWSMGAKISIDSASMANKGLEVIEAARLFELPSEKIDVVIHPQSVVHGGVMFRDGSFVAQMGAADMRIPISHALGVSKRLKTNSPRLDLTEMSKLDFYPMDERKFLPLALAREALKIGGGAPAVFSAANEIAVENFLNKKISFLQIGTLISKSLEKGRFGSNLTSLEEVFEWDRFGRQVAERLIAQGELHV